MSQCRHLKIQVRYPGDDFWFTASPESRLDRASAIRCSLCHAALSLGPSNDEPEAVQVEILAAEIDAGFSIWAIAYSLSNDAIHLARELATHDDRDQRDRDAWPWDPSRPVAGQYEQWLRSSTPIRAGAPEVIGLTPREARERTADAVAAEDALRDPEVTARNAAWIAGPFARKAP